jgi:two-component system, OmpR family, sensor histidine kinase VicK
MILNDIRSAKNEIMIMVSSAKSFSNKTKDEVNRLLLECCQNHSVKVRLLLPQHKSIITGVLNRFKGKQNLDIKFLLEPNSSNTDINTNTRKEPTYQFELKPSFLLLIVDRKRAMIISTKNTSASSKSHSVRSRHQVSSSSPRSLYICTDNIDTVAHITAFDSLWIQSDMYEKTKNHTKMQEEFINVAAHELRTPVQPILLIADILLSKIEDPEQHESLQVINRNANKLRQLADDILDVARIESNSFTLDNQRFNLNDVVYDLVQEYKHTIWNDRQRAQEDTSGCNLVFIEPDNDDDTFFVEADRSRITQVISNLLGNAIKFTTKGNVTVSLHRIKQKKDDEEEDDNNENNTYNNPSAEQVEVRVRDEGTGIAPEILPRLFTKFATKSDKGTGLGLFISKSIVEAHGGRIWAENNNINDDSAANTAIGSNTKNNKGCTFHFVLPILTTQDQTQLQHGSKKILLIDDDTKFTSELKVILEQGQQHNKYYVDTFNDPSIALEIFTAGFYDLALIDIELPNSISGFDLSQEIRKKDKKVKVCFLTSAGKPPNYKAFREVYGYDPSSPSSSFPTSSSSDNEQFLDKKELRSGGGLSKRIDEMLSR